MIKLHAISLFIHNLLETYNIGHHERFLSGIRTSILSLLF